MNLLFLNFLLLSISLLRVSAKPFFNDTAVKYDFDVSCFRGSDRFPAISYEDCKPLITHLESFTEFKSYEGRDFPKTYTVPEAPRCLVVIHAAWKMRDALKGSEFGTAAARVLHECEARPPARAYSFGGFVGFRPRWHAEVRAVAKGAGTNQTLVMDSPDVAVD